MLPAWAWETVRIDLDRVVPDTSTFVRRVQVASYHQWQARQPAQEQLPGL